MIAAMVNAGNKKVSAPSTSKHRTPTTPPMTAGLCSFVSIHWLTTITVNNAVMEKSIPVVSIGRTLPASSPTQLPRIQYQ